MLKYILPRLRDILFLAVFLGALLLGPRMLSLDSDLGRHLTLGNFILDQHSIPTTDILSFTKSGESRPPYEWLTQVLFALANRIAGLDGVILVSALLIAGAFAVVYSDAARSSEMPLIALVLVMVAVAASSLHWLPRPHIVTFLLLAVWTKWLDEIRRGEAVPVWWFVAVMLVWVNAHGGFIFGLLAWLAYAGGWMWEWFRGRADKVIGGKIFVIGLASLVVTFVTPSGAGNWQAVLNNNSRYILSRTMETRPADFSQLSVWPFGFLLVLTGLLLLANWKANKASHIFLLAGFAALGLVIARNIPLFAIVAAPILAERTGRLASSVRVWQQVESNIIELERPLRGGLWPVMISIGIALLLAGRFAVRGEAISRFDAQVFPVKAVNWLETHPQSGYMFNDLNWGGYLLYRLWPGQNVFVDSQTDFYGETFLRAYEQTWTAQNGYARSLEHYNVTWAILPVKAPLAVELQALGWDVLYQDELAMIVKAP